MKRALAVFLLVASLVAFAQAADVPVMVGDPKGADPNVFVPAKVNANPGDNIVLTWADAAKHSVLQSDDAVSCAKTKAAGAFFTDGALVGPATKTVAIPATAKGKWWFYCGVPGHCTAGKGGMTLTVDLTGAAAPPAGGAPAGGAPGGGAPPAGGASPSMPMPGGGAMPTNGTAGAAPSTPPSAASRNYNYFAVGVLFSSMCMAASYVL